MENNKNFYYILTFLVVSMHICFLPGTTCADNNSPCLIPVYSLLLSGTSGPLRIVTPSNLPDATLGHYYSQTLQAAGGKPPYRWLPADNFLLPRGLSMNSNTGVLSGIPQVLITNYTMHEKVVDAEGTEVIGEFHFSINPATSSGSPAPPSNLWTSPHDSSRIDIGWTDNSDNEDYFEIERANDALHFSYYDKWSGAPNIYDPGLTDDTLYCYRIRAHNSAGNSSYTNISCSWTQANTVPRPPTDLTTQAISRNTILLTWVNNSQSDQYKIFESVDSGAFNLAGIVPEDNVPGAYITGVNGGHTYRYKIQAHNNFGYATTSVASNAVTTPGSTAGHSVQIKNNSSYPIISLRIDGVEQFPQAPLGIPPNGTHEVAVASGGHTYQAVNGFWDGSSRFIMYTFNGTWTQTGTIHQITLNNPTISQLLTKFSPSSYYLGETWIGTSFHYQGFRFYSNGRYNFYRDNQYVGTGTYSLDSYPGSYTVTFKVTGNQNATGYYDELGGDFYMRNGPGDWPTVQYNDAGH
jgi:hypothetical protein